MKYTVEYLPLAKIKAAQPPAMTERLRTLRRLIWDSVHLLAVRKNKKDGSYTVVGGLERYEHLRNHTSKKKVPCLIEQSKSSMEAKVWFHRLLERYPVIADLPRAEPAGWFIIRKFLKREPRFVRLSRMQQLRVLLIGIRYKKTVTAAMKAKLEELLPKS
ncbi:hypothetical protein FE783_17050 [Paenibacillus mesophilus]|uniref:hypothetical protein n=1 Tax=Paenibacillus mesophilus TaxID=2582849 RepID=UPI00110E3749|nr:hypothetical protein [Paenibacillus mesophilus]TMV48753.1 hypothetical protein FE783_17050 [Paenibacillus mesophilus]